MTNSAEMMQHCYRWQFRRFADAVFALEQLDCCSGVYVERVSIREHFRVDKVTGLREKYFLLSVTLRSRLGDLERRGVMMHIKDRAISDY